MLHKDIAEGLSWDEVKMLFKYEKQQRANEKVLQGEKERFGERMRNELKNYEDQCNILTEGKPSELEIVKQLSVYDFELLLINKLNAKSN